MTDIRTDIVDVYVIRPTKTGFEALCLKRASGTRCAGTWETVHGHIVDGELPADAARRELNEETGLVPLRFYNVSRVESFYLHRQDAIVLIPVFCAFVAAHASVTLSNEHDDAVWLAPDEAARRFAWPREAHALADVMALFGRGDAGGLEDVLRVT